MAGPLSSTQSVNDIKRQLEAEWIRFLGINSAKLHSTSLEGSSPPSVFVGRYGYPKVKVGPLLPPVHGDTSVFDKPEMWLGKGLEEILRYRLALVRGTITMKVDEKSRQLESLQDMTMSTRPAEGQAIFEKSPAAEIQALRKAELDSEVTPFGLSAPLKSFTFNTLAASDRRIENAYYDTDLTAAKAMVALYQQGVEVSRISKLLSIGMLGIKKDRKIVPTRWSISATDSTISAWLVREINNNQSIDSFEVSQFSHLGNYYSLVLIPDDIWSFEMLEIWIDKNGRTAIASEYEGPEGLNHPPSIAGAYFAARLAVVEHLVSRGRKASVLVIREIRPEYALPVGVWQIREGAREALRRQKRLFEDLGNALSFACLNMSVSKAEIISKIKAFSVKAKQAKITDFVNYSAD